MIKEDICPFCDAEEMGNENSELEIGLLKSTNIKLLRKIHCKQCKSIFFKIRNLEAN